MAAEDKEALKGFLGEITEKMEHMKAFKKQYSKFSISLDSYLKKECPHDRYAAFGVWGLFRHLAPDHSQ